MREYIEGGGGVDRVSEEDSRRGLESCAPATPPITPPSPDPSGSRLVEKESWERKVSSLEQNANPLIAFLREINSWRIKRIEGKLQGLALPWIYATWRWLIQCFNYAYNSRPWFPLQYRSQLRRYSLTYIYISCVQFTLGISELIG